LTFRCIAYNIHRMVKLVVLMMVSTKPHGLINNEKQKGQVVYR
jgi:hypothetical protein